MTITETGKHSPRGVFIIHGHDLKQKEQLKEIVKEAGAVPYVLQEDTEAGRPLIEKFEKVASVCTCAIAVLTPDDEVLSDDSGRGSLRARQNVIYEIGWFAGRRGGHRVLMLFRGKIAIPSNLDGVDHLNFNVDARECKEQLLRFLARNGAVS